jgi:hypothetical protein
MLTKILVAIIAMLAGWILVRHLTKPAAQPAKVDAPKRAPKPADKVTTLERDPDTGIYR